MRWYTLLDQGPMVTGDTVLVVSCSFAGHSHFPYHSRRLRILCWYIMRLFPASKLCSVIPPNIDTTCPNKAEATRTDTSLNISTIQPESEVQSAMALMHPAADEHGDEQWSDTFYSTSEFQIESANQHNDHYADDAQPADSLCCRGPASFEADILLIVTPDNLKKVRVLEYLLPHEKAHDGGIRCSDPGWMSTPSSDNPTLRELRDLTTVLHRHRKDLSLEEIRLSYHVGDQAITSDILNSFPGQEDQIPTELRHEMLWTDTLLQTNVLSAGRGVHEVEQHFQMKFLFAQRCGWTLNRRMRIRCSASPDHEGPSEVEEIQWVFLKSPTSVTEPVDDWIHMDGSGVAGNGPSGHATPLRDWKWAMLERLSRKSQGIFRCHHVPVSGESSLKMCAPAGRSESSLLDDGF